jgi:hypothetical protein
VFQAIISKRAGGTKEVFITLTYLVPIGVLSKALVAKWKAGSRK